MAYILKDFSDIVRVVMDELKLQSTDTVSKNRIKSDINEIYVNQVAPFKRWTWLRKQVRIEHKPYYNAGTCSVAPDSTTVTLSVAPSIASGSRVGYLFSTGSHSEIYKITAHTANTVTLTLDSPYTGALNTTASFKIWKDNVSLPTDCRETFEVSHSYHSRPVEPVGLQEFRRISSESPKAEGRPCYYSTDDFFDPTPLTGEEEDERYRLLRLYPSANNTSTTLLVDYIQDVDALDLDADEPLMAISDRVVLKYGALALGWSRERNPEEAQRNWDMFNAKLARMAGNSEDQPETPQIVPNSRYILNKRGSRGSLRNRNQFTGGSSSGSYSSPTYISNAVLGSGNQLSGNLTVDSGITIDGRDISADGLTLDALGTLANGEIFVGNASAVPTGVIPSGDVSMSNAGVFAISSGVIVDGDVNASAAIALTKLAATTVSRALVSNASGVITPATTTATEIGYVNGVTSAIQTQIDTKVTKVVSTDNAVVRFDSTAGAVQNSGVTIDDSNNVIIPGNLTINGTTTTINATNLDVTDKNININSGGSDASSEGAGLTVARTGTSGSIIYKAASASKWAVGAAGSEADVVTTTGTQTLTGKSFDADGSGNSITNIENADIKAAAAIAVNKLAAVTASRALVSDGSGFVSAATTTATEIGYVNGVTSAIQTQINTKAASFTLSQIYLRNANSRGGSTSGETTVINWATTVSTTGSDMTYTARTTTAGSKITVNTAGVYAITAVLFDSNAGRTYGISQNSSGTSTDIQSLPDSEAVCVNYISTGANSVILSATIICAANDIIRIQGEGTNTPSNNGNVKFIMTRVQ